MIWISIVILSLIAICIGVPIFNIWFEADNAKIERQYDETDEEYAQRVKDNNDMITAFKRNAWLRAFGIWAIISVFFVALAIIRIVPTGEVGVKTAFGVVSGRANEGFNLIAPWEDIIHMNTKIQKQSFTALSASTKDAQSITDINIDVNYRLMPEKSEEIFATVGENYNETLISPLITQLIKDRLALYNAESLVTERNKIVDDIAKQLKDNLEGYGVDIVAVSLANYEFSADFSAALERKAVAEKEIDTAKNNQEKAKVEAETNRIKTSQLTEPVLMEKLIDAIRNGNGTYIINTNDLSIGIR